MTITNAIAAIDAIAANRTKHAWSIADLTAIARSRIAELNPTYHAYSHLCSNVEAQVEGLQRELDAGRARGPLHGVTVSVKGNIPVAGLPWTEGSAIYADRVAASDAAIVARVRAAGGLVLGTTTLSELAMYGVVNPFEPMGLNPWDVARTAGGSSTGAGVSAALGMAQINIGTDSGGSIRNPACHCGVVGFMPSIGALTAQGKPNHAPSLSTVGLVTGSVEDAETAFRILADAPPPAGSGRGLLVPRRLIDSMCDDETLALYAAALKKLEALGMNLMEVDIPGWIAGERAAGVVSLAECGAALSRMDLGRASAGIRARAEAATRITPQQLDAARAACATLRANIEDALRLTDAEAIVTPTWPFAAPQIEQTVIVVHGAQVPVDPHRNCFVRAANAVDACAITLPMGLYPGSGVPAGLHLMAVRGAEGTLLALAREAEAVMPRLPEPPPLRAAR